MKLEKESHQSCAARAEVLRQLHTELQGIDARRNEVVTAIQVLQNLDATPVAVSVAVSAEVADEAAPFAGVAIDLSDAKNLRERLVCIAVAVDAPIDAMEAARYLVAHGYSKSSVRNLRPHVYNALNDSPDFVKVERGVFEYLPNREKVTPAAGNLPEHMVH